MYCQAADIDRHSDELKAKGPIDDPHSHYQLFLRFAAEQSGENVIVKERSEMALPLPNGHINSIEPKLLGARPIDAAVRRLYEQVGGKVER